MLIPACCAQNVIFACEKAGTPLDCVLLDINMPVLDGASAARRLRVIEKDRGDKTGYWLVGCTGNARAEVSLWIQDITS